MAEEKESSTSIPLSQRSGNTEDPEDPAKSPPPTSPNSSTRKACFSVL